MLSRLTPELAPRGKPEDRNRLSERLVSAQPDSRTNESTLAPIASVENAQLDTAHSPSISTVNRTIFKWLFRLALVSMVILLVALIWFLWGRSSDSADVTKVDQPIEPATAMNSHFIAEPVAQKWASDAQLVSLSATWNAGESFQGGEGDWSLVYYSPTRAATALILVHDGQAAMMTTHGVSQPITLANDSLWQVDSPTVINRLRAAGGDGFLSEQPEATASMSLDLSGDAVWSVRLIDQMSRRIFAARISVEDGQIIEIEQSG